MDTDSDNSSINSTDSDLEDYIPPVHIQAQKKNTKKVEKKVVLPTCGKKENDIIIKQNKLHAKMCDYCGLFFDNRMITKSDIGLICQHCYFFFNFDNPKPKYGWSLQKYTELCHSEHNLTTCLKFQNGGTCYLCLYLLDLQIMEKNKIHEKKKVELEDLDDKNIRKITFTSNFVKKINLCNNDVVYM